MVHVLCANRFFRFVILDQQAERSVARAMWQYGQLLAFPPEWEDCHLHRFASRVHALFVQWPTNGTAGLCIGLTTATFDS